MNPRRLADQLAADEACVDACARLVRDFLETVPSAEQRRRMFGLLGRAWGRALDESLDEKHAVELAEIFLHGLVGRWTPPA
jgi:hypothetical protein